MSNLDTKLEEIAKETKAKGFDKPVSTSNGNQNAKNAESAKSATLHSHLKIDTAPPIPEEVYQKLPETLRTRCSLYDVKHRRDIFLIGSLPAITCQMPNVLAAHRDKYYSPDLLMMIVAPTGTGKGETEKSKHFAFKTDTWIREQAERAIEDYERKDDEEKKYLDRPEKKSLLIPANASSRMMLNRLKANGGSGYIPESEIDTLINATKQDWGNYTDTIRKAFHHESVSIIRTDDEYYIKHPRLSVCLTGTFSQFQTMFESAENGHFSRYGLFTYKIDRRWESHRPTQKTLGLNDSIEAASEKLFKMYRLLKNREDPIYIDLLPEQWDRIDSTFAEKMELIKDLGLADELHSSNNRSAIIALRLATAFTVLRTFEQQPEALKNRAMISPSEKDMEAALTLSELFIEHAMRLYYLLPDADSNDTKGERFTNFKNRLPNEFKTADALSIADELDIPERSVKYWLTHDDAFNRIKHGYYEKV